MSLLRCRCYVAVLFLHIPGCGYSYELWDQEGTNVDHHVCFTTRILGTKKLARHDMSHIPFHPLFSKQFTGGFSLRKKRLAAICSGRVRGPCPPCVRLGRASNLVSALCPASKPCLRCVHHVSALCLPCVRFGGASKPCPACIVTALCLFGRASRPCPPSVCHVPALCPRCLSPRVRLAFQTLSAMPPQILSALCPLWLPFRHVSAWARVCVGFGRVCSPRVRLVFACMVSAFARVLCRLWTQVSAMCVSAVCVCVCHVSALDKLCPARARSVSAIFGLCVRHVSAPWLLFVLSLSARCSLFISALCQPLSRSMVWLWPSLCQLCVRSLIFA